MKIFMQLPTEGFLYNFSWTQRRVLCSDLANKNSRTYKILSQNWSDKSRALLKNQNLKIWKWWNLFNFSHWFFGFLCLGSKFWFFEKNGSILGRYFICPGVFIGQITTKNPSLCSWEIIKKSFRGKLHKNFHFSTLWIWLFGIFDKRPQGCYEVKNSMGHL